VSVDPEPVAGSVARKFETVMLRAPKTAPTISSPAAPVVSPVPLIAVAAAPSGVRTLVSKVGGADWSV